MEEIYKKIEYPKYAKLYELEGVVVLIATVDEQGNVVNTNVIKSLGLGCDEEAEKAVRSTRFIPGQDESGVVESDVSLQIEFQLEDEQKADNKIAVNENIENPDTNKINIARRPDTECGFDECAEPIGGINSILRNFEISADSTNNYLIGTVTVRVDVDQFGNANDVLIIDGQTSDINSAVIKAVAKTRFKPAVNKGIRVPSVLKLEIPINMN